MYYKYIFISTFKLLCREVRFKQAKGNTNNEEYVLNTYGTNTFASVVAYDFHDDLRKRALLFCFSHHTEMGSETQRNKKPYPK